MLTDAGLGDIEVLKDIDYGAVVISHAPEEAARLAAKAGIELDGLKGSIRSLTFRARKTETSAKSAAHPGKACCGPSCCS
jgi:hypothetical protein